MPINASLSSLANLQPVEPLSNRLQPNSRSNGSNAEDSSVPSTSLSSASRNGNGAGGLSETPSIDDEVIQIYLQQAEAYCDEKQWEKASQACQEALAIDPGAAGIYKLMGNILQRQGLHTDAMGAYAKALRLQPNFPEVYSNLGSICAYKKQWDLAITYFKKAIERDRTFVTPYLNLAKVWNKLKETDKEMDALAIALKLKPEIGAAKDHYRVGQYLETISKAAGTAPGESNPQAEAAIAFYRQAVEQEPRFVQGYQRLADLLEDQGDWQEAVVCYRKVLDLGGADAQIQSQIQRQIQGQKQNQGQIKDQRQGRSLSSPQSSSSQSHRSLAPQPATQKATQPQAAGTTSAGSTPQKPKVSERDQDFIRQLVRASSQKKLIKPGLLKSDFQQVGIKTSQPVAAQQSAALPSFTVNDTSQKRTSVKTQQVPSPVRLQAQNLQDAQKASSTRRPANMRELLSAIGQYQQAIAQSPKSAKLYRGLSQVLAQCNQQLPAAEAMYKAFVLEPDYPTPEQCLAVGKTLAEGNKLEAAINCYRQAIQRQPDLLIAYKPLAQLLHSQNQTAAARSVLAAPSSRQTSTQQAGTQQTGTRQAGTQQPPEPAETDRPVSVKAKPLAAELLTTASGSISQASIPQASLQQRTASETVFAPDPQQAAAADAKNQAIALHKQGEALRENGEWEEAIAAYRQATALNPSFSWAHHSLGDCYKKLSQWQQAADAYQQAITINPDFVWSYYSLAEALEQLERWNEAAKNYRQVLTLEPDNEQAPPKLAGILQKLLKQAPRNVDHYKELAEQLVSEGKEEDAIAAYQMALQIQPDHTGVALQLSKLLTWRDPEQAHILLDRALSQTVSVDVRSLDELSRPQRVASLLQHTHLFDAAYYRATNLELLELKDADDQTLLMHYIQQGSADGRQPNPLFDDAFYRSQRPEVAAEKLNPLAHYHYFGYKEGCDPHPYFSVAFYYETHADVAASEVDPLEHYLACGIREGREAFGTEQFSDVLEKKNPNEAKYLDLWQGNSIGGLSLDQTNQKIGVYCSSLGNYFLAEIADFLAGALTRAGHRVVRLSEQDKLPNNLDEHWVVAPHEFFYLGEGLKWSHQKDWLKRAIMVNVEQPQTTWFSKAFYFLRHTRAIFDINVKSAAILQNLGLPAYWMPFGYLPDYAPFDASKTLPDLLALRSLPDAIDQQLPALTAPLSDRPIDLHFVGSLNARRDEFFARSAHWLSRYRCFLHIPPMGVPLIQGQGQALDTGAVIGLSRRSKILLNIHRDNLPYFEWHRIVFHGLWQNTLVVTEPCHDIPGLTAGEHFVSCPLKDMPDTVDWLLNHLEGKAAAERIRTAGHNALKEQFNGSRIMTHALNLIAAGDR